MQQQMMGQPIGVLPPAGFAGMQGGPGFSFANPYYGPQDMGPLGAVRSPGGFGAMMAGGMAGAAVPIAETLAFSAAMPMMGGAFSAGAGFAGQGFMGTMRGAAGLGLRGGAAAMGGGLAAAALPIGALVAASSAANYAGGQVYQGAQNIAQVGAMSNQYFGPAYGQSGALPGGQHSRGFVRNISSVLHEIAGDDTMSSMQDLKRVMDRAGQMGLLTGISSPGEFKAKFSKMVGQVKDLAQVLGTSLEEAMPLFGQMNQMGLWRASDVMGTAGAMRAVGSAAAPQLLQTMQSSAQRSFQMGGSLGSGAALGRNQFLNINEAVRSGVFSNEAVVQLTGGTGGVEGQRMLADRVSALVQQTGRRPIGRLAMAGLAEIDDGTFTGRVDQERLQEFISGNISIGDLQRRGMGATRSRQGAASFTARQDMLSQNVMASGGMELMGAMTRTTLDRAGFGGASEEIQQLMIERLMGVGSRDAQILQRLMSRMPELMDRRLDRSKAALEDAFRSADDKMNRSFEGLSQALGDAMENEVGRPFQEFGEELSTVINERTDALSRFITGRQTQMRVGRGERMRLLAAGRTGRLSNLTSFGNVGRVGRDYVDPGGVLPRLTEGLRRRGLGGTLGNLFGHDLSGRGRLLQDLGLETQEQWSGVFGIGSAVDANRAVVGTADLEGFVPTATNAAIARTVQLAQRRNNPNTGVGDFFGGEVAGDLGRLREVYQSTLINEGRRLEGMNEGVTSASARRRNVLSLMMENDDARGVFGRLNQARTARDANMTQTGLDALSLINRGSAENEAIARELGFVNNLRSSAGRESIRGDALDLAYRGFRNERGVTRRSIKEGTAYTVKQFDDVGLSKDQLRAVLEGENTLDLRDFMESAMGAGSRDFAQYLPESLRGAAADPNNPLFEVIQQFAGATPENRQRLLRGFNLTAAVKHAEVNEANIGRLKGVAGKDLARLGGVRGLRSSTRRSLEGLLERIGSGSQESVEAGLQAARDLAGGLSGEEVAALRSSGTGFGRQIAALASVGTLGRAGMREDAFRQEMNKKLGGDALFSLQQMNPGAYADAMKFFSRSGGDGKESLSGAELGALRDILKTSNVLDPVNTQGSRATQQEQLTTLADQLRTYTTANEKFVIAVNAALPELQDKAMDVFRRGMNLQDAATKSKG